MNKILGLDIGISSIGWALVEHDQEKSTGQIIKTGCRIVPTDAELLINFAKGSPASKTADRRDARSIRRQLQRYKSRRGRLVLALKKIGWLPPDFKIGDRMPVSDGSRNELQKLFKGKHFRPDWIIYYLRDKALREKIELYEFVKILYHFNQRRGFKSSRLIKEEKEEDKLTETTTNRQSTIEVVKIESVTDTGEWRKKNKVFEVVFADGRKGLIAKSRKPEWENQEVELEIKVITTKGGLKTELAPVIKTDWLKQKEKLDKDIEQEKAHVSSFFLNKLIDNSNYTIRDRHIERKRYRDELKAIWDKQAEFHPELSDKSLIRELSELLYRHNIERQRVLQQKDLYYILTEDIIYYQRPLRSQKNLIASCSLESPISFEKAGKIVTKHIRVAPTSSPVANEYKIWQTIHNLRIIKKEERVGNRLLTDIDETNIHLFTTEKAELFALFDSRENVTTHSILAKIGLSSDLYRLNYADETLPGNKLKADLRKVFKKHAPELGDELLNDSNRVENLWHLLYSIEDEEDIYLTLLKTWKFPEALAKHLAKITFQQNYGSLSAKAMKKLLCLMRTGAYFSATVIPESAKERINRIIDGEVDESIPEKLRERLYAIKSIEVFEGVDMPTARYLIYGKEADGVITEIQSWQELKTLKQHSLRNPLVEQIVNETIRLVRDVWKQWGRPDQIRVELARELRNNAKERERISKNNETHRKENKRITAILRELSNANPESMKDIERLKLWEEIGDKTASETIVKLSPEPTKAEIEKYKLWGEQNHLCPYTGKTIPLSRLFSGDYDIDHIIPQSRHFDDSFNNKTVCLRAVNKDKNNRTALEYIQDGSHSSEITLLPLDNYIAQVKSIFKGRKREYLLMVEPPSDFVNRQLNDTRYITRKIIELLRNVPIADEQHTDPVVPTNGKITNELKATWGLTERMKQVLRPRFERLETITNEEWVTEEATAGGKVVLRLRDYEKRIDHRHHTMDAIIVACTSRSHVQYFNTLNAQSKDDAEKNRFRNQLWGEKRMKLPWSTFHEDVNYALQTTVISFKGNKSVLQNGKNSYQKYVQQGDEWKKVNVPQKNEEKLWSLHYPLHKETMIGLRTRIEYKPVTVKEALQKANQIADKRIKKKITSVLRANTGDLKKTEKYFKEFPLTDDQGQPLNKIKLRLTVDYAAPRVKLDDSFTEEKIKTRVDDPILQKILLEHLLRFDNDAEEAFTSDGIAELNKNRENPIHKLRLTEDIGNKFMIRGAYTEAAKGTNLFFLIYQHKTTGERIITKDSTLSMNALLPLLKENLPIAESKPDYKWMILSPNDLVYMPDVDENTSTIDWSKITPEMHRKIYKMVSCTNSTCLFIPHTVSKIIADKKEFQAKNKIEKHDDDRMIKEYCMKLTNDRLGNLQPANWSE